MKWGKRLVGMAVLVVIVAGLAYAFMPKPPNVTVARVASGPMAVTVDQEGRTRVRNRYAVSAPVAGRLERLDLDVGDPVKAGEVITRVQPMPSSLLDPRNRAQARAQVESAEAGVNAAEARVESARAAARRAESELKRMRTLHERGLETERALDDARAAHEQAQAELRAAEFQVKVARADLAAARAVLAHGGDGEGEAPETLPVTAPVAGRVLAINRESAGPVTAGEPLVEIGDPGSMEVETDVLSSDAVRIRPGMTVRLKRWGGGEELEGRVTRVEPKAFTKVSALGIEEQRVWVISDIASPPERWRQLGDGYRVDCSFVLWSDEDVLQIPDSAVFDHDGGQAVFVVENGTAKRREIKVGRRSGLDVQVLDGLQTGETVITHPDETITNGADVTVRHTM